MKRKGGRSAAAYVVRGSGSLRDIGEIERTVLFARAAGMDPRSFGGRNLLAEIEKRRRGDGSISGFVSYTAFGILALRASGVSAGSATVRWLVGSQNGDGGFGVASASSSDSDMTGAALQALATVGRAHGGPAQRAVSWLRANQNDDGGFGQFKGRDSNSQSTSYALQGLLAAGAGGGTVSRARTYLVHLQRSDGSVAYSSSSSQTPVWVTAQALMALEGKPLPIAAVPRSKRTRAKAASERRRRMQPPRAAAARPARRRARAAARQRRAARARQQQATLPPEQWAVRRRARRPRPIQRAPPRWRQPPPRAARRIRSPCRYGPRWSRQPDCSRSCG